MGYRVKNIFLIVCIGVILISPAHADFYGHHAPGGWGLFSGSQIPEGFIFGGIYSRYYADKLIDNDGNDISRAEVNSDITINGLGLYGWWVSKYKILGANWGMLAAVYGVDGVLDFPTFDLDVNFGLGDIYWQPVNLGWHFKQVDFMASYGIWFPTGSYELGANDNTGLGMWTHEFGAGATIFFDSEKKWHFSAAGYLEIHSEKKDTDIRVGNGLTVEGGLGRSWLEGALSVGLAYYGQWKLTEDSIGPSTTSLINSSLPSSIRLPSRLTLNRSRIFALGPEVDIPIVIKGKPLAILTARYQWEFGARSRLEGQTFNLFLSFPFF